MSTRLSQDELDSLVQLKKDYNDIIFYVGEIGVQISECQDKLNQLNAERDNYLLTYKAIVGKDNELAKMLTNKYGSGKIDLQTGEISQS